jgi:myb proto-oncogene protein
LHGGKNWNAIAALVPGRTIVQCCYGMWNIILASNISPTTARAGKWSANEDIKLKDAVQTHRGKNRGAIAALVSGRTEKQCNMRWRYALDSSIDRANERMGKWAEDEDTKLKDAVLSNGNKNWKEIAALVPGRTIRQCCNRWRDMKI